MGVASVGYNADDADIYGQQTRLAVALTLEADHVPNTESPVIALAFNLTCMPVLSLLTSRDDRF
jgi:hypothetical protein